MKRLRLFIAALALGILTACAPMQSADFNSQAANVLQSADAAVTLTRSLLRAGKIRPDDAESLLQAAVIARDGVAIARSTKAAQGEVAGTARLRLAADSLDKLNIYLAEKGK